MGDGKNHFTRIDPKARNRLKLMAAERAMSMKELVELLINTEWGKTNRGLSYELQATDAADSTSAQTEAQAGS